MVTAHAGGSLLEGQDLLLQSGELQHAQRVVLEQEAPQRVPAPTNTDHHVFPMKHLSHKDSFKDFRHNQGTDAGKQELLKWPESSDWAWTPAASP